MDLSRSSRALQSLLKRPAVSEATRASAQALLDLLDSSAASDAEWRDAVLDLAGQDSWEAVAASLCCAKERMTTDNSEMAIGLCNEHLHHTEARVRAEVANVLGSAAAALGLTVYDAMRDRLLESVETQMARAADTASAALGGTRVELDDTTGWKSLESSLLALRSLLEGLRRRGCEGAAAGGPVLLALRRDAERLCGLTKQLVSHQNRHVRQATYQMLDTIARSFRPVVDNPLPPAPEVRQSLPEASATTAGASVAPPPEEIAPEYLQTFQDTLPVGLGDNWSQVRYEASVATRSFMLGLTEQEREAYFATIMPPMCLNRHYLAEGVRLYSQMSWRLVYGNKGIPLLERYLGETVECYVQAAERDNHVVREAACAAIAELGLRLGKEALAPRVGSLLDALMVCFKDESWPVRDAACVSSGHFCFVFGPSTPDPPRNLEPAFRKQMLSYVKLLLPLWLKNLADPIWSVREGAAIALGRSCQAYAAAPMLMIVERACREIVQRFMKLKEQDYTEDKTKKAVDQQLFSCGSLAPKLKRGGCSDCDPQREAMPWEHADGALYLLRELSTPFPNLVVQLLPRLRLIVETAAPSELGGRQHPYLRRLRDTLWRVLLHVSHLQQSCRAAELPSSRAACRAPELHAELPSCRAPELPKRPSCL